MTIFNSYVKLPEGNWGFFAYVPCQSSWPVICLNSNSYSGFTKFHQVSHAEDFWVQSILELDTEGGCEAMHYALGVRRLVWLMEFLGTFTRP